MKKKLLWNILLSDYVNKNQFTKMILSGKSSGELAVYNDLKGILFSDSTIQHFIEREEQYDILEAASKELNRKLRTFSAGEQKKEFLKYCLQQEPDYLVLDNPFDHLDFTSREELSDYLEQLSASIGLIQLVNRTEDLLDFIPNKGQIKENSFDLYPINTEINTYQKIQVNLIPKSILHFDETEKILIEMKGVSVSYNEKPIIDSIFWTIKQGEFWQLIGPNGAGKSTILSMITGENTKGYGQELFLFGMKKGSGESVWDIKKNIGIFSTSMTHLFKKNFTLEQMILSGFFDSIGLYIQPNLMQKQIVDQWLSAVQIGHLKQSQFHQLSLGLQRVALIIRAVLKHPPLLILDEPLEGLDDHNAALVIDLINILSQEKNRTIIYVSHRIEPTLKPNAVFELSPAITGSIGKIK